MPFFALKRQILLATNGNFRQQKTCPPAMKPHSKGKGSGGPALTTGKGSGVRETKVRGETMWCLDTSYAGGIRKRRFFRTQQEALAAERELQSERRRVGDEWTLIPELERAEMLNLYFAAQHEGLTLRRVWDEYHRLLGSNRLAAAKTIRQVIAECMSSKRLAKRRASYLATLDGFLRDFAQGREEMRIVSVTPNDIAGWLDAHENWSLSSRATAVTRVSTLFAFAVRRGYLAKNPCDALDKISIELKPPAILTVAQCGTVIGWIRKHWPATLGWFALCLFAGVRPEEADRITWKDIELEAGILTVSAAASKVRRRRIVHLVPSAVYWLGEAQRLAPHMPVSHSTRRRAMRALRERLKLTEWPKDVLRHTAASCLLALWRDAQRVALELGNSPQILLNHYHELTRKADAERWANLMPKH